MFPPLKNRDNEDECFCLSYCGDNCTIAVLPVVLPHDETSISASGLHAVAGVVREARVGVLPLPFLDLDSFGPRVCLDAE